MDRETTLRYLQERLPNRDLNEVARQLGVTIEKGGKINKGWVGQTIERLAELPNSNRAAPDGLDFELKTTAVAFDGLRWQPQETIKVTNLNPELILEETFESSILWRKLERLILVGCEYQSPTECRAVIWNAVDVTRPDLRAGIQSFWEDVRHTVSEGEIGQYNNLGTFEDWLQLRPTGNGKLQSRCPITQTHFPARAFYATKRFIRAVLLGRT